MRCALCERALPHIRCEFAQTQCGGSFRLYRIANALCAAASYSLQSRGFAGPFLRFVLRKFEDQRFLLLCKLVHATKQLDCGEEFISAMRDARLDVRGMR